AANSGSLLSHQDLRPRKVDLLGAQKAPDLLLMHIAQGLGQQRSRPAGISIRRRFIQQRTNAPAGRAVVLRRRTGVRPVFPSGERPARPPCLPPAPARGAPFLPTRRAPRGRSGHASHSPCAASCRVGEQSSASSVPPPPAARSGRETPVVVRSSAHGAWPPAPRAPPGSTGQLLHRESSQCCIMNTLS